VDRDYLSQFLNWLFDGNRKTVNPRRMASPQTHERVFGPTGNPLILTSGRYGSHIGGIVGRLRRLVLLPFLSEKSALYIRPKLRHQVTHNPA
jgi:hypothetical protein